MRGRIASLLVLTVSIPPFHLYLLPELQLKFLNWIFGILEWNGKKHKIKRILFIFAAVTHKYATQPFYCSTCYQRWPKSSDTWSCTTICNGLYIFSFVFLAVLCVTVQNQHTAFHALLLHRKQKSHKYNTHHFMMHISVSHCWKKARWVSRIITLCTI